MNNKKSKTQISFPEHLKPIRKLMPKLVEILESGKEDKRYCFAWFEENKSIRSSSAVIEHSSETLDRGIVFRAYVNGIHYEKSTNRLDENFLMKMANEFRNDLDKISSGNKNEIEDFQPLSWDQELKLGLSEEIREQLPKGLNTKSEVHFSVPCEIQPDNTDLSKLKEVASKLRSVAFEKSRNFVNEHNKSFAKEDVIEELAEVRAFACQELKTHIFVDRYKNMSQVLPFTIAQMAGITRCGKATYSTRGGIGGMEIAHFSKEDFDNVCINSVKLSKASFIKPGRYQVITGPDVTGVIAHEAFGHTQEGDTWMKGRSIAENLHHKKIKVGNDLATIVNHPDAFSMDDKTYGQNGSYFFDHEGTLSRKQIILDKGMLSTPMTDLTSATKLKVPRTANGKREGWRRPLMVRQTNTYFTPGDKTLDELISMVKHGFLARYSYGGMEDPKGGSLTAGAAFFEEIENGKLTGKLFLGPSGGHIELSDPVFTLLEKIIAKSKTPNNEGIPDIRFGGCGKYHKEGVDAGCGGPYILWKDINCG